jgi:hypothetical protein
VVARRGGKADAASRLGGDAWAPRRQEGLFGTSCLTPRAARGRRKRRLLRVGEGNGDVVQLDMTPEASSSSASDSTGSSSRGLMTRAASNSFRVGYHMSLGSRLVQSNGVYRELRKLMRLFIVEVGRAGDTATQQND